MSWQDKDAACGIWRHWCPTWQEDRKTWLANCGACGKPAPDFPELPKPVSTTPTGPVLGPKHLPPRPLRFDAL